MAQIVLFIKAWAKRRHINSAYSGTMSSYGYVLMVLHFLMNVERPPIIPNLQLELQEHHSSEVISGYTVKFLRDTDLIQQLCAQPRWKNNQSSVGTLLRNFYRYYSGADPRMTRHERFNWARDVISIRTQGGLLQKDWKGWTAAITVQTDQVSGSVNRASMRQPNRAQASVRQRYLLAVEDPFEHEHNVARTVHQRGLDAIRDEFRRAWWKIISTAGRGTEPAESLLDELLPQVPRQLAVTSVSGKIGTPLDEANHGGGAAQPTPTTVGSEKPHNHLEAAVAGMRLKEMP